jgi:DNA mismatch repair protein MutL
VGVIGRLYVVLESDRGMVLMDQHAAHERVLFEQMMQRLEHAGSAASQRLLLPETIELAVLGTSIATQEVQALGGVMEGVKDTFRHWWLVIRH